MSLPNFGGNGKISFRQVVSWFPIHIRKNQRNGETAGDLKFSHYGREISKKIKSHWSFTIELGVMNGKSAMESDQNPSS